MTTRDILQSYVDDATAGLTAFLHKLVSNGVAETLRADAEVAAMADHLRCILTCAVAMLDAGSSPEVVVSFLRRQATDFLVGCRWRGTSPSASDNLVRTAEGRAYGRVLDQVLVNVEHDASDLPAAICVPPGPRESEAERAAKATT